MTRSRPEDQTTAEWLSDQTGEPVDVIQADLDRIAREHPARPNNKPTSVPTGQSFMYVGHRTTTKGALILDFADMDSGEVCSAFFNVSIEYQRGPKAGQARRTGDGCQFHPAKRSKFRRFWLDAVGCPPRRWAETHKQMHLLAKTTFTGRTESAAFATGEQYFRLKEVRRTGDIPATKKRQLCDNVVTTKRQEKVTSKPSKANKQKAFKQSQLHDKESAQKHVTRPHNHTDALPSSCSACYVEVF